MKKMFFGALLLFCGIIGVNTIVVLSIVRPWTYNGIDGLAGFLLGTNTKGIFCAFVLMAIIGIGITFYEAYLRDKNNKCVEKKN